MTDAKSSLGAHVLDATLDLIRRGELKPGETHSIYRLADLLGVSRTPTREAVVRLADAGMVQIVKNRGFRVLQVGPRELAENFAIRLALEPIAVFRAAQVVTGFEVEELVELAARMDAAAAAQDEGAFWAVDRLLHRRLLTLGGGVKVAEIVEGVRTTIQLLGPPTTAGTPGPRTLHEVSAEHRAVVQAVIEGRGKDAARSMTRHLQATGIRRVAQAAHVDEKHPTVTQIWDSVVGAWSQTWT